MLSNTGTAANLPRDEPLSFPNAQQVLSGMQMCGNTQVLHTVANMTTGSYFSSKFGDPLGLFCWCSAKVFEVCPGPRV